MSPRPKVSNHNSAPQLAQTGTTEKQAKLLEKILSELQQINDSIQDLAYQLRCLNISATSDGDEEDEDDADRDVKDNTEPSPH